MPVAGILATGKVQKLLTMRVLGEIQLKRFAHRYIVISP